MSTSNFLVTLLRKLWNWSCWLDCQKNTESDYTEKVDVWSMGVILYAMLSADFPFHGDDEIRKAKLTFQALKWIYISKKSKEFVKKMLVKDASLRCTVAELLLDDWFDADVVRRAQQIMQQ